MPTFTIRVEEPSTLTAPQLEMILNRALVESRIGNYAHVWRHDDSRPVD